MSSQAIAARGDLITDPSDYNRDMYGAMDGKVVSAAEFFGLNGSQTTTGTVHARVGPTVTNGLPPFCWAYKGKSGFWGRAYKQALHFGHPTCYNYDWDTIAP